MPFTVILEHSHTRTENLRRPESQPTFVPCQNSKTRQIDIFSLREGGQAGVFYFKKKTTLNYKAQREFRHKFAPYDSSELQA